MKEFLSSAFFLSLVSYFFLGFTEEVVLLLATLLFLFFLVSRLQTAVLNGFQENLFELEKSYLFLFFFNQSKIYLNYFSVLTLKSFFVFLFQRFVFFFSVLKKWLIIM